MLRTHHLGALPALLWCFSSISMLQALANSHDYKELLDDTDWVVVGRIVEVEEPNPDRIRLRRAVFHVEHILKGENLPELKGRPHHIEFFRKPASAHFTVHLSDPWSWRNRELICFFTWDADLNAIV